MLSTGDDKDAAQRGTIADNNMVGGLTRLVPATGPDTYCRPVLIPTVQLHHSCNTLTTMTCSLEKQVQPPQVVALNLPENSACTLLRKRTIEIRPIPIPVLAPDGVLVKVMATGICGSDLHNFTAGGVGGRPVLEPLVMGHESVGEVIAIGDEVTTHKVGDRVAVEPGSPCRKCRNCKEGRMNICLYGKYCGAPGSVGSLTRFAALPADMAPHLPEGIEWDVAGALQPLAIGVQIGKRCDIRAHQTVAVMGCGPIGLIAAAVAHAYCVSGIIGFDNNPKRVEFARKYLSPITGKPIFDKVFLVEELVGVEGDFTPGDAKFEAAKLRAARYLEEAGWSADGVDRVIEASGAEDAAMLGIALAKMGATCE